MTDDELLKAADWVRRTMGTDADVRMMFTSACASRGFSSPAVWAREKPDEFEALYEAARSMTDEIPVEQLRGVDGGKPR